MHNAAEERVRRALRFEQPDRVPRFFSFWPEFVEAWRQAHPEAGGDIETFYGSDLVVVAADETAWPSRAGVVAQGGDATVQRTGWGVLERAPAHAKFTQVLATALPERVDPDRLVFEDPRLDSRYRAAEATARAWRGRVAVFCKTGGPYLRAAFMRGQAQFLMDMAEDPGWVRAFVERVSAHITAVGVESLRRFGLQGTGIGIYDDVCSSRGPMMGRRTYERLFYPSLCRMVAAYKAAGAACVFHHCDGAVSELLDLWADAGIDAVHPLEARSNPHPRAIRERFGTRLAVIGGLDNCVILPRGDRAELRAHLAGLRAAAEGGGLIIAPHSIGPDIQVATLDAVVAFLEGPTKSTDQHGPC